MKNIAEIKSKLLYAMEGKKMYRNSKLSLVMLASEVNCSPYLLKQILKKNLNTCFYDFVNHYRINEIKEKLVNRNYNKYNIVVLAFESGFNSKATFQRIFKTYTGLTPTEYRQKVLDGQTNRGSIKQPILV